jgi:hypothetical protein
MKYLLLLYGDEGRWTNLSPEQSAESMKLWTAYGQELVDRGAFIAGEALQPTPTAKTVRVQSGEVMRTDGPFAETREQLGGFYMLECKDLEEALAWAAKVPELDGGGSVEVRAVIDYGAAGSEAPSAEASQA